MPKVSEMYGKDAELKNLENRLKRTVRLAKTVWQERYFIQDIIDCIAEDDLQAAADMWNELDYKVQELLIIAPTKGGPFTTKERAIVDSFWKITVEDIENG